MPINFEKHLNMHVLPEKSHASDNYLDEPRKKVLPEKSRPFDKHLATNFGENFFMRENSKAHEKIEEEKELASIAAVFKSGNLEAITSSIEEDANPVFEKEISRIKKTYEKELSSAAFLTEKDWKMLTAIELCDKKTLEHSIGTFLVAKDKIEKRLTELGMEIAHEGVQLEQLYRACLFHDIGKLAIPEFILNNNANEEEWAYHFMELSEEQQDQILVENKITPPDSIRNDLEKMTAFFSEKRIRAVKFVPMKAVLSPEQAKILTDLGINPEDSLGEIMCIHEKKSEEILSKLQYPIEALLAGNHHNYKYASKKLGEKPASLSALHISIEMASNIIHLADVQHALNGERTYRHKQPMLRIMVFLVDDAENGKIDPELTARWIDDELKKMNSQYLNEIRNMKSKHQHHDYLQKRHEELLLIDDFLSDNMPDEKKEELLAA